MNTPTTDVTTVVDIDEALSAYAEKDAVAESEETVVHTRSPSSGAKESHCQKLAKPRHCRWLVTSLVCAGATIALLLFLLVPR